MSESEAQAAEDTAGAEEVVEETAEEAATTEDETSESSKPELTVEDLQREVSKLRKENAAKRVKAKEVETAAKKWEEHVNSQKSELEKLQDAKAELEKELSAHRLERLQKDLAKEHGVDSDLAEFIVGSDRDEMVEKAKKLAKKTVAKKPNTTAKDYHGGKTESVASDTSKWFKQLFD